MLEATAIQRYINKSIDALIDIATTHFNKFIRERDRDGDYFFCPTCGKTKKIVGDNYQACHLYPAGNYGWIRFYEDNVWGGCKSCNYFKHGAGHTFSPWVRKKIGEERFAKMEDLNAYWKQRVFKWDRFTLIDIIIKYKNLNKMKSNAPTL